MRKTLTVLALAAILATGCTATRSVGEGPEVPAKPAPTNAAAPAQPAATEAPATEPADPGLTVDDAVIKSCKVVTDFGIGVEAKGTVTNNTDARQDVWLQIEALNAAGDRVGDLGGFVENLGPGQTATYDAFSMDDYEKAPVIKSCRVIGVTADPAA